LNNEVNNKLAIERKKAIEDISVILLELRGWREDNYEETARISGLLSRFELWTSRIRSICPQP
jgi:hypothetical protein